MKRTILITMFAIVAGCTSFVALVSWKTNNHKTLAIQASVEKGFSLLQTSGAMMIAKSRCASCHHSTMTAMVAETMEKKGMTGLDTTAVLRDMAMTGTLDFVCNPNLNNQFVSAKFLAPYVLMGLAAGKHPADFSTDIAVDYLIGQELPDGSFKAEFARVPLEAGDIHLTAVSIHSIALYASPAKQAQVKQLITKSRQWMEQQHPSQQQEMAFQLMGMNWCGSEKATKEAVIKKLLHLQNKDGGWSQLATMASDPYATGQSLYALAESGLLDTGSDAFQNGVNYLLSTQQPSGAWVITTRSNPIQPFVNTEFPPYDDNQFISAAASNWAVLALATSLPDKK